MESKWNFSGILTCKMPFDDIEGFLMRVERAWWTELGGQVEDQDQEKILQPFNIFISMYVRIDRPVAWWPHRHAAPKPCSPIAL